MKKFLVVLLACAMIFSFATTAFAADSQIKEFNDIADQSQAAKNAIMKLAVLGVIEGNEGIGGAFRPADNLTRAEFAKIVCYLTDNVKLAESLTSVGTKFSDVSTGNWYTGWVNAAAQSGYYVGDPGGTFRPNANITMQEVVTVTLRAAGYTDKVGSATGNTTWPSNYITKAMNVGLLDNVTFVGSAAATRADMAVICEEVLGINMVVHISNEIAYALSLASGDVDVDGFSEVYYITNETNGAKFAETILHKAFDGVYYDVQIRAASASSSASEDAVSPSLTFDESYGWGYEDFSSTELALYVDGDVYSREDADKKFEEVAYQYTKGESLASTYYITRDFDLTELAGMQVELTVIDGEEICFVDVVSSYLLADSIYADRTSSTGSAQNIIVDSKSYRASNTMGVKNVLGTNDGVVDYAAGYNVWDETDGEVALLNLRSSYDDDDFPGKVYLDKNGRIYAVKNYNAYNMTPFAIFDDLDSDRANWKEVYRSANDNLKIESSKDYTIYKNGEFIKLADLEENDVVSRLDSNGAPFFYVTTPQEGELTQQTSTKLTLAGTGYRIVPGFQYSDDGGETFASFNLSSDEADFGDAEYTMGYNFSRLAWVASNLTNAKVIGVITKIEPSQNWSASGGTRENRYEEITIYNAEGKEVTYKFTNDFRDGYTYFAAPFYTGSTWVSSTNGATKWATGISKMAANSVETITTPLAKGDIVQLAVDKNDKVKRVDNYAKFEIGAITAKVTSSNSRITLPSGTGTTTPGTYTLNKDAIVFNVSPDSDLTYDDVDLMSVSSVLAKDFDAAKVVAFDTKTGANTTVLYIVGDISLYQFGVISGQGRDSTGDYYTLNGKRVYSDSRSATVPSVISYKVSGGEASLYSLVDAPNGAYLAQKSAFYVTNIQELLTANNVTDTWAVVGTAESYSSGTKALKIGSSYVYVTSDTFLYDLVKDDDVSSAADLKDKLVISFYDKDNNALFVAVVSGTANTGTIGGGGVVVPATNAEMVAADATSVAAGTYAVPFANQTDATAITAWVQAQVNAILVASGFNTTAVVPTISAAGTYTVTLTNDNDATGAATANATITVTLAAGGNAATIATVGGATVTWGTTPANVGTVIVPNSVTQLTASSFVGTDNATVAVFTDAGYSVPLTFPVALTAGTPVPTVGRYYVLVTSQDGQTSAMYEIMSVTRQLPLITSVTINAANGVVPGENLTVTVMSGTTLVDPGEATIDWQYEVAPGSWLTETAGAALDANFALTGARLGQRIRAVAIPDGSTYDDTDNVISTSVGPVAYGSSSVAASDAEAAKLVNGTVGNLTALGTNMRVALTANPAVTAGTTFAVTGVTIGGSNVSAAHLADFSIPSSGANVLFPTAALIDASTPGDMVVTFTATVAGTPSAPVSITIPQATLYNASITALRNAVLDITGGPLAAVFASTVAAGAIPAESVGAPILDDTFTLTGSGLVVATPGTLTDVTDVTLAIAGAAGSRELVVSGTSGGTMAASETENIDFTGTLAYGTSYQYVIDLTVTIDTI